MSSEQPDWGPRGADGVLVVEEEKTLALDSGPGGSSDTGLRLEIIQGYS